MSIEISYFPLPWLCSRWKCKFYTQRAHLRLVHTIYLFISALQIRKEKNAAAAGVRSRSQWVDVENRHWLPPRESRQTIFQSMAALIALLHTRVLQINYPAWERDAEWKWRIVQRSAQQVRTRRALYVADGGFIKCSRLRTFPLFIHQDSPRIQTSILIHALEKFNDTQFQFVL